MTSMASSAALDLSVAEEDLEPEGLVAEEDLDPEEGLDPGFASDADSPRPSAALRAS